MPWGELEYGEAPFGDFASGDRRGRLAGGGAYGDWLFAGEPAAWYGGYGDGAGFCAGGDMEKDMLTRSHDLAAAQMSDIDVGASSSTSTRGAPPHSIVAGAGLIRRRLGRRGAGDIVRSLNWVISAESNVVIAGWAVDGGVGGSDVEGECRSSSGSVEASMRPDECRRDGSCTGHPRIRSASLFASSSLQHVHSPFSHSTPRQPSTPTARLCDFTAPTSAFCTSVRPLCARPPVSARAARACSPRWPQNGPMRP